MLMAFLLYPLMIPGSNYTQLWALFSQPPFLINMVNILFVAGLLFSFLPIASHPAIGMPLLGCIATALFFKHQYALAHGIDFSGFPTPAGTLKIIALMLLAYWITRWLNRVLSQWVDLKFMVSESENLISDINYLIFQMPVVLAYGQSLLPAS
jgi:small-conductance mechanosensitive channel